MLVMTRGSGTAIMIARTAVRGPTTEILTSIGEPRRITAHVSGTANSTAVTFAKHSTGHTTLTAIRVILSVTIAINTRTAATTILRVDAAATGMAMATSAARLNFDKPL